MIKYMKRLLACALGGVLLAEVVPAIPQSPFAMEAYAHSGRSDSHGRHRDGRSAGTQGSYHYYCGGHEAHLHENGVCPYDTSVQGTDSPVCGDWGGHHCSGMDDSSCGWKQDGDHHKYRCEDGSMAHDCWKEIDGCWYSFDENDCMRTGWYDRDDCRYYLGADGKMVTGEAMVDGVKCFFDQDGKLVR